jgi:hypothetical protein
MQGHVECLVRVKLLKIQRVHGTAQHVLIVAAVAVVAVALLIVLIHIASIIWWTVINPHTVLLLKIQRVHGTAQHVLMVAVAQHVVLMNTCLAVHVPLVPMIPQMAPAMILLAPILHVHAMLVIRYIIMSVYHAPPTVLLAVHKLFQALILTVVVTPDTL